MGVTSLFISSKFFEVEPLDLDQVIQDLYFDEFIKEDFFTHETKLLEQLKYEIYAPNALEF